MKKLVHTILAVLYFGLTTAVALNLQNSKFDNYYKKYTSKHLFEESAR